MSKNQEFAPSFEDWESMVKLAWDDEDFHKLLETDPTAAIERWARDHNKDFRKLFPIAQSQAALNQFKGLTTAGPDDFFIHCC